MKRRSFLKAGSLLSTPFMIGGVPVSAFSRSMFTNLLNDDSDRVLVLIQLNGGNDGLNTIIPLDQYEYMSSLRSNVLIPESAIINIEDSVGLHPAMSGLGQLYGDQKMTVIQSVAYPDQNRSHFRSTDIWNTGSSSNEYLSTGWFGRYFDHLHPEYPENYPNSEHPDPIAVTIGFQNSETCQGIGSNFSIALDREDSLQAIDLTGNNGYEEGCYASQVQFVQESIAKLNAYSEVVNEAFENGNNSVEYSSRLGEQLRLIAKLISGGLKTKVYVANLGGFDTHANQVSATSTLEGEHADLLRVLSTAISNFQADLTAQGLDERVVGMTYSEFGRRIVSNGSNGTDHGTAAPMIVFGNCASGLIIGDNPDLSGEITPLAGVAMQYDFRSVYASMLMDWFGAREEDLRNVLYEDFQYLPMITSCSTTTSTEEPPEYTLGFKIFPNPVRTLLQIHSDELSESSRVDIYDMVGHRLITQYYRANPGNISIDLGRLTEGTYVIRLQSGNKSKSSTFVKL